LNAAISKKFHQGELYNVYNHFGCRFDAAGGKALFRVWAPKAEKVYVVGDFNDWQGSELKSDGGGIFEGTVSKVKEFDSYKFLITAGGKTFYKADPYAFHAETAGGDNSKVFDLSKIRIDDGAYISAREKRNIYRSPVNIYEVHIGSWRKYADGNYFSYRRFADDIVPYLKSMNYTHVELMGISEHPFDGSWGYQVTGYYAPTSRYGTPEDFAYLVEKCHAADIGVILDWVPGHFPKDDFGLADFDGGALYEPSDPLMSEHEEWGTKCFDYGKGEVQTFLCGSAMMWFDVYHVDGLRVDAVASMLYLDYGRQEGKWRPNERGGKENIQAVAFLQKLNAHVFSKYSGVMMIAEESTAWPGVTKPVYAGGLGFNFKWNMGWMNDALFYASKPPVFRGNLHDKLTFSLTYAFSENYVLPISHDEVVHGKCSLLNKMPGLYDNKFAGERNFLMNMYAHPGKKLLFMGSEFGQFIEWDYRRELDWKLLAYPAHASMQSFVKELNGFYLKHPALWKIDDSFDGFEWLVVDDNTQNVIIYQRKDGAGNKVVAIVNFSDCEYRGYRFGADEGTYTQALVSSRSGWGKGRKRLTAQKIPSHGKEFSIVIDIPPMSGIYLTGKDKKDKGEE
jgi:1,4-alpha-glucan branching enzyme